VAEYSLKYSLTISIKQGMSSSMSSNARTIRPRWCSHAGLKPAGDRSSGWRRSAEQADQLGDQIVRHALVTGGDAVVHGQGTGPEQHMRQGVLGVYLSPWNGLLFLEDEVDEYAFDAHGSLSAGLPTQVLTAYD